MTKILLAAAALAAPAVLPPDFASPLTWKKLGTGATERFAFTAVYDAKRDSIVAYGGEKHEKDAFDILSDVWEYKVKDNAWTKVETKGDAPARRAYHSATFDDKRGVMWMFGGLSDKFAPFDDLWKLDTATMTWSPVTPAGAKPGARFNAGLHFDPARNQLVLFSGCKAFFAADNAWSDAWTYDIEKNAWSKKKAAAPSRWQAASALAPELDLVIVHGGFDGNSTVRSETYLYSLADDKWTDLGKGFKATDAHAAIWDPIAHAMIVYGGATSAKNGLDQVWAFDPKSKKWSQLATKGDGPGARAYHVLAWNPETKCLWTFGGTMNQFMDEPRKNEAWSLQLHK
jgi:N-acetylneuraminic acid mutarotase